MSIPTDPTQQPQNSAPEQQPQAPQYAAPQQPEQPQQPQYAAPQQPQAPQYAAPQQPQYAAPQQPQYAPAQPYAAVQQKPTNTLSIIALISAFVLPFIVPVVLGHISLSQIKKTGEGGRGLALTAVILGYIEIALWVLFIIAMIALVAIAATTSSYSTF